MDATTIIDRVQRASALRDLGPLVRELGVCDAELIFRTLFPIAVREQGVNQRPVLFSALAIHALNPPCPLTVDDAVSRLLTSWDISIEEVPWYLVKQFSSEEVLASVDRLSSREHGRGAVVRLRTIQYWVAAIREGA
jgi:hypothetical protein